MMSNTALIKQASKTANSIYVGTGVTASYNLIVPTTCNLIKVWACGSGGGGGGGFSGASGGGGGGGASASAVIGLEMPVTPGETLQVWCGAYGTGGAVGAAGTTGDATTGIKRGSDYAFRSMAGQGGQPGLAALGGAGGQGPGDLYISGGSGTINANGGNITYGILSANALIAALAMPFLSGTGGGGGCYQSNGTSFTGGTASALISSQPYGAGGVTGTTVGSGAGGSGAPCWPRIYPYSSTWGGPNGGNDGVAGNNAVIYGAGGGGGGRNAAGGNGGPSFVLINFL
jgi:hypothetical protein